MEPPAMDVRIRDATTDDAPAIRDIYNYNVEHSTCTWDLEPETLDARLQWLAKGSEKHPRIVAESGGEVVGWGSLSPFHSRCGYAKTVEFSVYVRQDQHRRGIGRMIVEDLIERAKRQGHHAVVGSTCSEQTGSLKLQESLGFKNAGQLPELGRKFGRWLDVVYMVLLLDDST